MSGICHVVSRLVSFVLLHLTYQNVKMHTLMGFCIIYRQSWVDSAGSTRSMERGVISLAAGVSTETYFHLMSGPNAFDVQKLTEVL